MQRGRDRRFRTITAQGGRRKGGTITSGKRESRFRPSGQGREVEKNRGRKLSNRVKRPSARYRGPQLQKRKGLGENLGIEKGTKEES